jgi:hypothetical protein
VPLRGYGPALSGELEQEGNPDVSFSRRVPPVLVALRHRHSRHCRCSQVPSGHEMRLPFWMAKVLKGKEAVDLKLPRHFEYKGKFRQQLALDPSRMNLREKDPRFFLRGAQLAGFVDEQERDSLRVDLKNAYAERYKTTVDSAATATGALDAARCSATPPHIPRGAGPTAVSAASDSTRALL